MATSSQRQAAQPSQSAGHRGSFGSPDHDVLRAFLCSGAVLLDTDEEIQAHLESSSLHFDRVHVSYPTDVSKILVAHASDAIFIAFRGSEKFDDNIPLYVRMEKYSYLGDGSVAQSGLLEYGNVFTKSPHVDHIIKELCGSSKRIVFCGHRIGGAVAHMVLMRFWKRLLPASSDANIYSKVALMSIAFGAPPMCDRMDAEKVNLNPDLKKCFLNYVLPNDPAMSIFLCESTSEGLKSICHSVGEIVKLTGMDRDDTGVVWKFKDYDGKYRDALMKSFDSISLPTQSLSLGCSIGDSSSSSTKELVVSTPAPVVTSARWSLTDTGVRLIVIHGKNLLFLREDVSLNDMHSWKTVELTDNKISVMDTETDRFDEADISENVAENCIIVRTAFGATNCVVTQDLLHQMNSGGVRNLLPRVVHTLMALSCIPNPIPFSKPVLKKLDEIVQCVPGYEEVKLSTFLTKSDEQDRSASFSQNITHVNKILDGVIEFLTRKFMIGFVPGIEEMFFENHLIDQLRCLGLIYGLIGAPFMLGVYLLESLAIILDYSGILGLAIEEADSVTLFPGDLPTQSRAQSSLNVPEFVNDNDIVARREWELHSKVHQKRKHFRDWIMGTKPNSVLFHCLTRKSKEKFLAKVDIVVHTIDLFKGEVMGKRFLGIQGAEDAGKSTFIEKALKRFKQTDDLPKTGIHVHTDAVKPYKLNDSTWLVDFPGSNGINVYADDWKNFTALPSACVLLLVFKDDIKEDQCQMYRKMKQELKTHITVVFNKVDTKFTPREEAKYTKERFTELRQLAVKNLHCKGEDVHFACLQDKRNKLLKLKKVGVLGFEELADKLGLS